MTIPWFGAWLHRLSFPCVLLGLSLATACAGGEERVAGLTPPPAKGALVVTILGLEAGVPANVSVSGPGGFQQQLNSGATLDNLTPGSYSVVAGEVSSGGHTWLADAPSQSVVVNGGQSASAQIRYGVTTGALSIAVTGLPDGVPAGLTLSGPGGFNAPVSGAQTLTGLAPGVYSLSGVTVVVGIAQYQPTLPGAPVAVTAGTTPVVLTVAFARLTGSLAFQASGLPQGVVAPLTISGPGGFSASATTAELLPGLDPGSYLVSVSPVQHLGHTWSPNPANYPVTIVTSQVSLSLSFAITTGGLTVSVTGLPAGTGASVTVTGPGGFSQGLTETAAFVGLVPGSYLVTAGPISIGGQSYTPSPASQTSAVPASTTPNLVVVQYNPTLGSLVLTVSGLPGGVNGAILVTGPGGFSQTVTATTTLTGLTPGSYSITGSAVSSGGQNWAPAPSSQSAAITAGTIANAAVSYSVSTGSLSVTISGLPGGASAAVAVTGPGGFSQNMTGSTTLTGLVPGSYAIVASNVASGGQTWGGTPASQAATVNAGGTSAVAVSYAVTGPPTTLNLRVDGVYLTQATQRYDGTTPLVAGRDAYLRVFTLANEANTATPAVRVRLYSGAILVQSYTISAPSGSVPLAVAENVLASTWNVLVPGSLVQPNLMVLVDVDPSGLVAEANETDNSFPVSGSPGAVDVRSVPTFDVRFVPVLQTANGLEGVVNSGNTEAFLVNTRKMLPVAGYSADVRTSYTTSAPALESGNGNGAWGTILSEVRALKTLDGSSQYYYGVVKTSYSSGVAGIGYVGGGARTALGWDRLPSGSEVTSHELGHNMGRSHAPCGGAGGPDPSYPYAGGKIGVWGLDVATLAPKDPAVYVDLMGYCDPDWVSDYNWAAMVSYRQAGPNNIVAVGQGTGRGLLVWGRITDQGPILEPAFVVNAPLALPPPGPHRLEAMASDGTVLYRRGFSAVPVGDLPTGVEEGFAFVIPIERAMELEMTTLRVVSGGRSAEQRAGGARDDPGFDLSRDASGRAVLRWDRAAFPMVLVRDAVTGEVLSFARGGEVHLPVTAGRLRLTASDGVRTRTEDRILR